MKRISLILLLICNLGINIYGATIKGLVKVENHNDYGVFVYVENHVNYDITDQRGNFKIDGLELNKEYTLVFQKGDLPDYKKKVVLTKDVSKLQIIIPDSKKHIKKAVTGMVRSKLKTDIFIELNNASYGIIVKPNRTFSTDLSVGKYKAKIHQVGAYTRNISFEVKEQGINDLGVFDVDAIDYNSVTLRFDVKPIDGVIMLYKDDYLQYSKRLKDGNKIVTIDNLKSGSYNLVIKQFGKTDYEEKIEIKGNIVKNIKTKKLSRYDNLYLELYPKNIKANVKLLENGNIIKEVNGKTALAILESLDYRKKYDLMVTAKGYRGTILKRVKAGDRLSVNLVRDITGTLISGYVYPFNSGATIMLLDKDKIIGRGKTDKFGYYEINVDQLVSGRKRLRVKADGFNAQTIIKTFNKGVKNVQKNIVLTPKINRLSGKVVANSGKRLKNVLVIIEELSIWQYTNDKGEYYFKNIPSGNYHLIYKKIGYKASRQKTRITKDEQKYNLTNLKPIGKIIFRSNVVPYRISINGRSATINKKLYEFVSGMGRYKISGTKKGYISVRKTISLTEPGEIRDFNFEYINVTEQNRYVNDKIALINEHIKNLKIVEAEEELYKLSSSKYLKSYESDYIAVRKKLKKAKRELFEIDRNIKKEIEKVRINIDSVEDEDNGYLEKQRKLQDVYKQSIDYLEKIVLYRPYTTYRTDIHNLQGDIYIKMGMINSSKNAYEEAKKYRNRRTN